CDLRMTDQEVREEMKEMQVDPQMQKRRKELQTQLLKQPLTGVIAGADVVITTAAEVAVAISYQPAEMIAPMVIAKGAGSVAEQIRQLAGKHAVPIVERSSLAQFLYTTTSV